MPDKLNLGWPNRITITRMLLIGPFVVCLLNLGEPGHAWFRWCAVLIFSVIAISDMLDGYLARKLHQESDLGKFLDPLADKILITSAVLILTVIGVRSPDDSPALILPSWVAVAAIGKDLIVCIGFAVIYLITGKAFINARLLGKSCTTVQLILVLAMLLHCDLPDGLSGLPRILWWLATLLAGGAALDYLRLGSRHLAAAAMVANSNQHGDDA